MEGVYRFLDDAVRILPLLLLGAVGCGARSTLPGSLASSDVACDVPERTGAPKPVVVQQVNDIGALGQPPSVSFRDGGSFARIGERRLWTFGDTLLKTPATDGRTFRSATAAYGTQA